MTTKNPYTHDITWRGSILTVGQLRALIEHLDDHTNVVLTSRGRYNNIRAVVAPQDIERSDHQCLTFWDGEPFDARQI